MAGRRRTWRRVVLLGVPSLYVLLGLLHPTHNPELGDETDHFIDLHIAQLFLIMGLGYVLWLLVEGVTNRAATLARALIIPFLVAYTALDAVLGIAWGIAAETANDLPATDQPGAGRLVDELDLRGPGPTGPHPLLGCRPALACGGARGRRRAQGHSPARRPRVDGTRRGGVHARTRPTDGSDRDGVVPPRHRVDRVPASSGRNGARGGRNLTKREGVRLIETTVMLRVATARPRARPWQCPELRCVLTARLCRSYSPSIRSCATIPSAVVSAPQESTSVRWCPGSGDPSRATTATAVTTTTAAANPKAEPVPSANACCAWLSPSQPSLGQSSVVQRPVRRCHQDAPEARSS